MTFFKQKKIFPENFFRFFCFEKKKLFDRWKKLNGKENEFLLCFAFELFEKREFRSDWNLVRWKFDSTRCKNDKFSVSFWCFSSFHWRSFWSNDRRLRSSKRSIFPRNKFLIVKFVWRWTNSTSSINGSFFRAKSTVKQKTRKVGRSIEMSFPSRNQSTDDQH